MSVVVTLTCIILILVKNSYYSYSFHVGHGGFLLHRSHHRNQHQQYVCSSQSETTFGNRIDASTVDEDMFRKTYDGTKPVVLFNVFNFTGEKLTRDIIKTLQSKTIEYDNRRSRAKAKIHSGRGRGSQSHLSSYECTLKEYINEVVEHSNHEDNVYMMNEDILKALKFPNSAELFKLPEHLFGIDYFKYFPENIRPKVALIIGGEGARSFLHVDPYEWCGWNYLLEGRKLWTFLPPETPLSVLNAYAHAPDAWGKQQLSTGWVSTIDLYKQKVSSGHSRLKTATATGSLGGLNAFFRKSLQDMNTTHPNWNVPIFSSGNAGFESSSHNSSDNNVWMQGAMQIIQEEGDLVLIPPNHWHQVYHLQPSIGIASQYFNELGKARVFSHILSFSTAASSSVPSPSSLPKHLKRHEDISEGGHCHALLQDPGFHALDVEEQVRRVIETATALAIASVGPSTACREGNTS